MTNKYIGTKLLIYMIIFLFTTTGIKLSYADTTLTENRCDPAGGYCLLTPLGNTITVSSDNSAFSNYLQQIINMAISATAAISIIMLIIGGLEYILSSVSEAAKKEGKERITNAIVGVLIALSGYLILNTINPNLLKLELPTLKTIVQPKDTTIPVGPATMDTSNPKTTT